MKNYLRIASVLLLIAFLVPAAPVSAASGIFYIMDNSTGGGCTSIGIWNPDAKECTLTTDITGSIQILSDNITLNGDGHTLVSPSAPTQYGGTGVYLAQRKGVVINNLTLIRFQVGIQLSSSSGNELKNNTITDGLDGIGLYGSSGNIITGNTMQNNSNSTRGEGAAILIQASSNDNKIENNTLSNNYFGIYIASSSSNNRVRFNIINSSGYIGIVVDAYCINNEISSNTVTLGRVGIVISYANNTRIYNNNFIDNIQRPWNNQWQNYGNVFNLLAPIGGNYWSDFDSPIEGCNDTNSDSFCDAPYTFLNNQDNLPWTHPINWENHPPAADAGGPYAVDWGVTLTLNGSNSTDPDNNITSYEWDINNDGLYNDASGVTTTISFTQIGDHLISLRVTDDGGLNDTDTAIVTVTDPTPPAITPAINGTEGNNGWYTSDVVISWDVNDPESGIASSVGCDTTTLAADTLGDSLTCSATNEAGLTHSVSVTIPIDKTAPTITWAGDINNGDSFYFGSVPIAPTCTASDSTSGLDGSCVVSGYAATVGSHTLTATAKDNAGNQAAETRSYTVNAWTLTGFYQPVDMNGVYNTVKNGSTVPLKFEVFSGSTELTDIAYIKSLTYAQTSCDVTVITDEIETIATGNTSLRYDTTTGQFIYNWKTPNTAGKCYRVTLSTFDGSLLTAYFKLK